MKVYFRCAVVLLPALIMGLISAPVRANPVDPATILVIAEYGVDAIKLLSNIPTYSATSNGSASSSLFDSSGNSATTLSVDRLFMGAASASSSVDVNSHIFGSVADASALANWTTSFVVTEPGLSGIYLGWSANGGTSAYSNYNANAISTVASSMSLNGVAQLSETVTSECHTTTSDCSRNGPVASSKTFVFENSPSVGDVYSVVGSLSAVTHAFSAAGSGEASASGTAQWTIVPFSLPRLSVNSLLTAPARVIPNVDGHFTVPYSFAGIGVSLSASGNKDLTVTGVDFNLYENDGGEGGENDLVGSYFFDFTGGPDAVVVGAGQSLYNFFNTPITLSPSLLNRLIDTEMDMGHLDFAVEGAFRYADALGYTNKAGFSNVPEPATALLVMLGVSGLAIRRKFWGQV